MNNEIDEYTKGQNDMLALIKEIYYTSSKKEFEKFLGKDDLDGNEVMRFLQERYMRLGKKLSIDVECMIFIKK